MRNIWEKFLNEAIKVKGLNLSELLIFKIIIKEKGHLFYIEPNGFNKLEKKKKKLGHNQIENTFKNRNRFQI